MLKKVVFLIILYLIFPVSVIAYESCFDGEPKAFPKAEGYGALTVGGRGGKVYMVSNLNDSGSGSLRECIEASGPRICVFRVSGVIELVRELRISNPEITIAGQTAPNNGITLTNTNIDQPTLKIFSDNVIVRHLKMRPNTQITGVDQVDGITISKPNGNILKNVIIDHVSVSFAIDEALNTWDNSENISIQNSIFSYSLIGNKNGTYIHKDGNHSKGPIFGDNRGGNLSFHHNFLAHNIDRNPGIRTGDGPVEVINNIVYSYHDPTITGAYGGTQVQVDIIGNYYRQSDTYQSEWKSNYGVKLDTFGDADGSSRVYVEDNISPSRNSTQPENFIIDVNDRDKVVAEKFASPQVPVTVSTAESISTTLLEYVGANGYLNCDGDFVKDLDWLDTRAINDYVNKTGRPINLVTDIGFPNFPLVTSSCVDSDSDFLPDNWENRYFMNISTTSLDPNGKATIDSDGDGYTDFEEYLNNTNPVVAEVGCNGSATTPTPTAPPLNKYDVVSDGKVDLLDIIDVIKYLFGG